MSLYTPVFPPLDEINTSQKASFEGNSVAPIGKQQNYVKYLRDLHLFLSTQSDVLSPPSRPNSPSADQRIQKIKNKIQDIFHPSGGDTSSGRWIRAGQTLKLRCATGRNWTVSRVDPCTLEQATDWILPDEEFEWLEWEKKREENRRLKGNTNTSQQIGSVIPATPESQRRSYASLAGPSQRSNPQRQRYPPDVSPGTLRAATEKVRKWQASMVSGRCHVDSPRGASPAPSKATAAAEKKRETAKPQRSYSLGFAVVKPAAKVLVGKKRKGSVPYTAIRDNSTPTPSHKPKTPTRTPGALDDVSPIDDDKTASKRIADITRIVDVSETFLPPSFPSHLETSTPLPDSKILVRTKPPPILPVSLSTPPPSAPANPPDDLLTISVVAHAANESSSLPPQIDAVQPGKRSRASTPVDGIPNGPPVTPPAKRLRTLSQNYISPTSKHSKPISPNGALSGARELSAPAPSRHPLDFLEVAPVGNVQPTGDLDIHDSTKIPSPTKSIKSYFSAPDSDPADSPVAANLLLESPVSPMLSYAQNASIFLPQITSTQVRKGSPTPEGTGNGILGIGYSSQFDVERHVDRVSELLERDVDFDGWLRDARTVETSKD